MAVRLEPRRRAITDVRRKRLKFRAARRGIRELDLFMEAFVATELDHMSEAELDEFDQILDLPDQDVYAWILGQASPPDEVRSGTLDRLIRFHFPPFR